MTPITPTFFETPEAFRRWLEQHHASERELWVGFYKVKSGKGGMVYRQALDEALCYGWIDGLLRSIDEESYAQRFTPRKKDSTWSRVNVTRAQELLAEGRMRPPGIEAFERRPDDKSGRYSFEQQGARLPLAYERTFKASPEAWAFFSAQPPSYRRVVTWWVMSAKKEETRTRRLLQLISDSAAGQRIRQMPGAQPAVSQKPSRHPEP
ncbi:MAG TPA: YdeI/OmpD-associated family protein [Vicinamibacterales bacterium]|nr:YdeI/OmpD-associated family protein [Vicinamibacterales bacterium]